MSAGGGFQRVETMALRGMESRQVLDLGEGSADVLLGVSSQSQSQFNCYATVCTCPQWDDHLNRGEKVGWSTGAMSVEALNSGSCHPCGTGQWVKWRLSQMEIKPRSSRLGVWAEGRLPDPVRSNV